MTQADAPPAAKRRPRDAATLILIDRSLKPTRVLLGKRHAGHRFMPDKFVFPGGALEPADRMMSVMGALDDIVAAKLLAHTRARSPHFARALALAALRETFEETGLAVGVTAYGAPQNPPSGAWSRFAALGVFPALESLDFLARAITPPGRTKRFDTRFFVADAKLIAHRLEGVIHAEAELTEFVWAPLDVAMTLDIPQITRTILEDLVAALAQDMSRFRPRPYYHHLRGRWRRDLL